ncbi:TVP38/TMEM64 family protein [Robertmurraya yapensis]|uniref:TVP38/TMEM64 family membrane protein n=1 Tax=Bacillus yapensis TaxID=2492960 RepID=A0A3S0KJJ7_9BACI|nr:VTT domain-containing protein [Bacillus yapensis]RTR28139.1 TVP38/TMEM64 family protein [Bacillus yapensis]TKS94382.1 TVP38/TMEM64 family protein [Bacillus yapensis]
MLDLFPSNPLLASFISILLNIAVAIAGIIPSTFITIGTVSILGFKIGVVILILGEAAGALISFSLYRRGILKLSRNSQYNKVENRFLYRLKDSNGIQAFFMVILLRVLPFVPSGIVTLTAAISKIGTIPFFMASTLGKIPALIIEAYSLVYILNFGTELQILIAVMALLIIFTYIALRKASNKES